jgi:UDP-N-acetylmuramoyl-L-alanyl-D-glutamate--2,6-diaminopimelate ligase
MKLGEVLERVAVVANGADPATEVASLACDSRRVHPGTLFFAIQGAKADGHAFVPQALERGAVAVVSERPAPEGLASRWIQVCKIRRALSEASRTFLGRPDHRLRLVGITGTNGKTTTAFILESIFRAAGIPSGLFGTVEYRFAGKTVIAGNTTPESLDLLTYMEELVRAGGQAAVLEVSSHALAQERVWGFPFSVAIFTNLTRDHLDFHKDFEHYFAAKRRLFEGLGAPPPELAVLNADDPWARKLLDVANPRRLTFGLNSDAEVKAKQVSQTLDGLHATLVTPQGTFEIESRLVGRANLSNILAASAAALGMGLPHEKIQDGVAALAAVPGRFERVDEGQSFLVVVDYAHTDDALRNVLKAARELTKNRLMVVFGCGGDRDRSKRPLMGEAAGSLADFVVLTSDNPRSEDPLLVMNDALVGLQKSKAEYVAEVDREAAIRKAIEIAGDGDVVVIAGKGHETHQILKDRTIPFDDREVARRVLREMGFEGKASPNGRRKNGRA